MIPKLIHYCWFGEKEKSQETVQYIQGWKEILPDYEIHEWNETNFKIDKSIIYVKEAYKKQKWAFVTDYVRLYALYQYGGIYFDTDVKVIKSFDPLLNNKAFIGAESLYSLCTATIASEPHSKFIDELLQYYNNKHFILSDGIVDTTPNSQLFYQFINKKNGYRFTGEIFDGNYYKVYPAEYFSPINCYTSKVTITDNTYSIHYYAGTWKNHSDKRKDKLKARITNVIGEANRERIKNFIKGTR